MTETTQLTSRTGTVPDDVRGVRRTAEIGKYHVLVDPPRRDLVALAEVAALVADVPMATVNLITVTEQHSIATAGMDPSVCRREDSMCTLSISESAPVIVQDARADARFEDNPFVTGVLGNIRFYAAHQLTTPEGVVIGTLCVFDDKPRTLGSEQARSLASLAERVVDLLELELRTRELTRSLAELEQARTELERSNRQLVAFAGQVSHDLASPLAAVSLALDMATERRGSPGDAAAEETGEVEFLLERARGGTERMQAMITDLLTFARVGGQLSRDEVDLAAVVHDVQVDLAPVLAGARVTVGALPTVSGDRVMLRAVLQNLMGNAAKFVRPDRPVEIEIGAMGDGSQWRVEVRDRGPGLPDHERERVFEPLARATETAPGSGIGLATVRRIVESHGGRAGLDPRPGGGTTAWFTLPA